jgi:uncharacterized membrane protein
MDLPTLLKYLHVVAAIVWLGGGTMLILLGARLGRNPPPETFIGVIRHIATNATRVFVPATVVVLLTGLGMVHSGGYGWPAWIVLALAGIAFTGGVGGLVLGPLAERAVKAADAGGAAAGMGAGHRLLRIAKFDYVVQFSIVFLMVAKPGWTDFLPLALVAGAIALGAVVFLRGGAAQPA